MHLLRCFGASLLLAVLLQPAFAQLKTAPDGGNKRALVGETIGITDITIHYDRPAVRGRQGAIWGKLVPYGFTDLGFGTSKQAPWRAGANENTTFTFSTDVAINGHPLPAGTYGFHIAVYEDKCTLIFSRNSTSWGSFFYDPKEDVLRLDVKQQTGQPLTEYLVYDFSAETDSSAEVGLKWENWRIPFTVSVDLIPLQLASFRNELRSEKSFSPGWQSWHQAAAYCLQHNVNLEEALQWADMSISGVFIGQPNFATLSTKAGILEKLGRSEEASKLMAQALPMGNMNQVHAYARQLLAQDKNKEAISAFKKNYEKYPNTFTTNMGMVRASAAEGDNKKAISYAEKALAQAPDPANKSNVEQVIKALKEGKKIN
ncbi:DUF2911 domain-containing protein [Flavihumibacter petaseus]|uniref:Uncharacterized protein n=1 Tax=Flavihumibacter petaseus NBRC 106054 TaxID=1220578 RepID=A0A0E9N175_9BACT|nr:DUF2911 domain-containing protein [Flavihumibacter petaseus]GAO43493.1 hypothetical protein FPE01S_02_05980 [Flavihumibacter petaseus NBRC 106054]